MSLSQLTRPRTSSKALAVIDNYIDSIQHIIDLDLIEAE